ncbi:hypothetical protein Tco_1465179 [Tanacetum coccineum]
MSSSEVDLNAADTFFIKVLCDDDSDDSDGDINPRSFLACFAAGNFHTFFLWLGLDRQDLSKLYGMVVKHYEAKPIAGAGMMLWGDLHVLFESVEGETFSGTVLYMFADTPYPLSASTMKKMLKHKLEVEINGIGNDMTHAEQLIAFIKNRLAACAFGWFLSQVIDKFKTGLGYNAASSTAASPVVESFVNLSEIFDFATMKTASTPMEPNKALIHDEELSFTPKMSHLHAVKRIFSYLKGQPKLDLWYPRDSAFDLEAFSDSDYARASLDRKSTTGGCQFLSKRLISWQCKKQDIVANSILQGRSMLLMLIALDTGDRLSFSTDSDFLSTCSINYALTVSPTIYASYIEQFWNTVTSKIVNSVKQIHAIIDDDESIRGVDSVQRAINADACLVASQGTNDNILKTQYTQCLMLTFSGMDIRWVLALRGEKIAQGQSDHQIEIEGQEARKEEKDKNSITYEGGKHCLARVESPDDDLDEEDSSKQGRESDKTKSMFQDSNFDVLDDDMEDVKGETVHTTTTGVSAVSAPVTTPGVAISTAEPRTPPTTTTIFDSRDSPRPIRLITTLQPLPTIDPKDKELAQRLHKEELAELDRHNKEDKSRIREQKMITYLKHMGKYTHQQLKHKNFEEVQKLYEREKKWIDDFKPIDDDSQQQAESTKKRPRADSEEESSKKQKLEEDNDAEKEELRDSMDVVPRDDVAIDVESLATKYPIVDWKTHILNENMMYYQIIRADGSSKNYKIFSEMLDDFDRQDVIDLHRLVNERYETTSPEGYDLLLWGDLKTLFEPNEEDEIWKNQQDYNLISWRLFDSCGVHVLLMNTGVAIHMMIEKKYPLTQEMLSRMLNRRLEVDYESEMAFELLRFTRSQLQK